MARATATDKSRNVSKCYAGWGPGREAGTGGGDRRTANPKGRGDKAGAGCGDEPSPPQSRGERPSQGAALPSAEVGWN